MLNEWQNVVRAGVNSYHVCMQARHLFRVTDRFAIRNRGIVLVPGIIPIENEKFQIGDKLELRFPHGEKQIVTIAGLERMNPADAGGALAVLLSEPLTRQQVPVDTEVWSVAQ